MSEVIYRLRIRGLVQGVFFRRSMVEQAQALGVRGRVRNRLDGSVESVVAGDPGAVEQLILWARRGPKHAVVTSVEVEPAEGSFNTFDQRETV